MIEDEEKVVIEKIKPKFRDYLLITATRFLPITNKKRRQLRLKFLKVKEDIVLYEYKSNIVFQVILSLCGAEILYMGLSVVTNFGILQYSVINTIIALLIEYICFLIATPIVSMAFYPFTGFVVKLEE